MLQDARAQKVDLFTHCAQARDTASWLNALTQKWHLTHVSPISEGDLVERLHRANFDLWHLEDEARDRNAADWTVAQVKRSIDTVNQQRNDFAEGIDEDLLRYLRSLNLPAVTAELHSETPGQILDRLSILALKVFHTEHELRRPDIRVEHAVRNKTRLALLQEQQNDLADCLSALWRQVCAGGKRFKQYRQLKMYNDPELNPVLYRASAASEPS